MLHEFWHCVQYSLGFPTTTIKDNLEDEYVEMCNDISSTVLDINVCNELNRYGFEIDDPADERKIPTIKYLSMSSIHDSIKDEYLRNCKMLAIHLINITFTNSPAWQKQALEIELSKYPKSYLVKYYNKLHEIVSRYDPDTPDGCLKIFIETIQALELQDYITVFKNQSDCRSIIDKDCKTARLLQDGLKRGIIN